MRLTAMPISADRNRVIGFLLTFVAVLSVSIAAVLVKAGLGAAVDPVTLLMSRMAVATLVLWGVFPLLWPGVTRIDRRGLVVCAAAAAANAISMLCYYLALVDLDASVAHMVFSLYPVAALLILAARGERIRKGSLVSVALGLVGVYLLITPGGRVDVGRAGLVLVSAVLYPFHMALVQWYLKDYRPQTVALYVVSFIAVIVTAVRALLPLPWEPLPAIGWIVVLVTAVVSTVLSRAALFAGIQRIGSGRSALLGPMETLLTVLWAVAFLGERLVALQWMGGVLVLAGGVLAIRQRATG